MSRIARAVIAALFMVAFATSSASSASAASLFARDSFWNAPLPGDAALDESSSPRTAALVSEINREQQLKIGPWIDERYNSTPFYVVGAKQPQVHVTLDSTNGTAVYLRKVLSRGVPIPNGARPAAGSDGHMTVYQPATDTMWEFYRATLEADGWHADWGGAMQHVSTNPGYYSSAAWPDAPSAWNWGSTASSIPIIAGTITIAELRTGHIDHALALAVPNPCARTFSWPAQRTDGGSTAPDCMPEGAHLRLDPSLDVDSLNVS